MSILNNYLTIPKIMKCLCLQKNQSKSFQPMKNTRTKVFKIKYYILPLQNIKIGFMFDGLILKFVLNIF